MSVKPDVLNYRSIFDRVSYPVYVIEGHSFIYSNPAFTKLVGKGNLAKKCYEIFDCHGKDSESCEVNHVINSGDSFKNLVPFVKGKKEKWYTQEASPIYDDKGKVQKILFMLHDMSEIINLESEIINSNVQLRAINKIANALNSLDLQELLDDVLATVMKILNVEKGGIHLVEGDNIRLKSYRGIGDKMLKYVSFQPIGRGPVGKCAMNKEAVYVEDNSIIMPDSPVTEDGVKSHLSVPLMKKNSVIGVITVASTKIRHFTQTEINLLSTVAGQIAAAIDNAQLYIKTKELSRTDILTGLSNFSFFEEILKKEIKRCHRTNKHCSLLMIDLDDVNLINDFYGHDAGDRIIVQFSDILRSNLRKSDYIARYAGDEFLVLLPDTDAAKAKTVAEKIRKKTAKIRLFGADKKQMVTASIGLAVYPLAASTESSLVKSADLAMCQAKKIGKNQTCIYHPSLLSNINFDKRKIKRFAKGADLDSLQALVTAVDLKDNYTQQHSSEVSLLAVCLGQALGLTESDLEKLRIAGLLHDVGKIGIRDSILMKPGPLTKEEYEAVKAHPNYGVDILKHSKHFKEALPIVLHHHEHFDGSGYPKGLSQKKIPTMARILSIADAYQAMVSDRPYRKGMSTQDALDEIKRCSGTQFDPNYVETFSQAVAELDGKALPNIKI